MLKGCKRNMIVLHGTGSDEFDTAYFVLKEGRADKSERSLVDEANRIVGENRNRKTAMGKRRILLPILLHVLGFAFGFLLAFFIFS